MAGQRSSRGLRRWSRLGKRCTRVSSRAVSPAPRSRAAPLPAPRECDLWCLVCLWWRSCDKGKGDAWCSKNSDARACIVSLTPVGPRPPPFLHGSPSQHTAHPPYCVRQASISTMVCGGGGGAAVLADGGVVKGRQCACAHTCKHTPILSVPQQVQHRSQSTKQLPPK